MLGKPPYDDGEESVCIRVTIEYDRAVCPRIVRAMQDIGQDKQIIQIVVAGRCEQLEIRVVGLRAYEVLDLPAVHVGPGSAKHRQGIINITNKRDFMVRIL